MSDTKTILLAAASTCILLALAPLASAADDVVTATPAPAAAADAPAAPSWTGHIDLLSKYILRGITSTYGPGAPGGNANADAPEASHGVVQWGADWSEPSGFYLGYFGSTINYSYLRLGQSYADRSITNFQTSKSIENDLYGGYAGKVGEIGYTLGMTAYVYLNSKYSNALETKLGLSYGDFSATAQTLLQDVVWGNKGDTYWALNYSKLLPYDVTLTGSLGYYTYTKQGKFLGTVDTLTGTACGAGASFADNGCYAGKLPSSGGFRHLIIGFTQPLGKAGASWGLQEVIGGENRFGVQQKNQLVGSLTYGF